MILLTISAGPGLICSTNETRLFVGSRSGSFLVTEACNGTEPGVEKLDNTVTVTDAFAFIVPIVQLTMPLDCKQVPCVEVALINVALLAKTLVKATPVETSGPSFIMVKMLVKVPPAYDELVATVRIRSSTGGTRV